MVDQFLGGLFGGQDEDDEPTRRRRAHDFVDRYDRGAYDQMGDDEVMHNYRAATSQLSPDQYQAAAADALRQLSPEQRRELRREMKHRSRNRYDARDDSPEELARTMHQADQDKDGGGLASLFGFGKSDQPDAHAQPQSQGQDKPFGGVFDNPLAKVALAGVAAVVAKRITDPNR